MVFVTDSTGSQELWPNPPSQTPTAPWSAASSPVEWTGPFSGLVNPHGVALAAGNSYWAVDTGNNRVVKWQNGTNALAVVPFTGLNAPQGLGWSYGTGDVWVADTGNNRVLRMQTINQSTPKQTVLGFTGLNGPQGVTVDRNVEPVTAVYVADTGNNRVLKLTIDPTTEIGTQSILPFAGLNKPTSVSLDANGNLYVADSGNNRVLKLEKAFLTQ
jgi:DNA-binding beta-propeller fold protein YncE